MSNCIKKFLILIFIFLIGCVNSFADGSYKNELTKVKLSSIGGDDVKITLYMAKPYSEPLRLLKKNDGEFVLILPETYTSAPQKPSISDVIGEVTDADVKLYSFISNLAQNGYKKIVIKTNGLVNIYPEAVTSGGGTLSIKQEQQKVVINNNQKPQQNVSTNTTVNKNITNKNVVEKVATTNNQTKTKEQTAQKDESKPVVKDTPNTNIVKEELPVINLPKIVEKKVNNDIPLKEINVSNVLNTDANKNNDITNKPNKIGLLFTKAINKTYSFIKAKVYGSRVFAKHNILIIFGALLLLGFALRFSKSIINSTKQQNNNLIFDDEVVKEKVSNKTVNKDDASSEYSDFFKTLIEAEVKGNNPFTLDTPKSDKFESDIKPTKTHEEVLNEDQNLTWQEKFRAIQKNKKALLKDDENSMPTEDMEITENMNIENPIKKLTQDFKAVRKVLEKQKAKQKDVLSDNPIEQDFTPEKIDKIEVISFEDFQKNVSKPKIQVNSTTSPIKAVAPKVLTQLQLGDKKGLYLVDYKDKVSLVGYINDKVFRLNTCSNLRDTKLYARLSEKNGENETYIVKFDNNKMIVDVNNEQMKLKLMY